MPPQRIEAAVTRRVAETHQGSLLSERDRSNVAVPTGAASCPPPPEAPPPPGDANRTPPLSSRRSRAAFTQCEARRWRGQGGLEESPADGGLVPGREEGVAHPEQADA